MKPNRKRLHIGAEERTIEQAEIKRWVAAENEYEIHLEAVLPDRPLVARPEVPLMMLPGQNAMFFIGVPLWIRIKTRRDKDSTLCELPSIVLSNSWFGTAVEGELCYGMRTAAKRELSELNHRSYRAVCPLEVRNAAKSPLEIERICLRPQTLQVFQGKSHLWTASGRVTYRGENEWSKVVYGRSAPSFDPDAKLVGEAREKKTRGFLAKTFQALASFSEED